MIYIRKSAGAIIFLISLFVLSAFTLLGFRDSKTDVQALSLGGGLCLIVIIAYNVMKRAYKHLDRFTFIIPMFLSCVGLVVQYRLSAEYGMRQFVFFCVGLLAIIIAIEVIRRARDFGRLNYLFMALCALLLVSTLIFSDAVGGAKNWLSFEKLGFSVQPSEFAKILFIIISAYFFSAKRSLSSFWPYIAFTGACVLLLVISRDLGAALLFALTFIVMFYVSTGKKLLALGALGVLGAGAAASYYIFDHVKTRVDIWENPWSLHQTSGYQIVQSLMAIASGSFLGMGLTLGYPSVIPAARTDFAFAVICEEFGVIVGVCVILFYLLFIVRGALIAMDAKTLFDQLLVFGVTAMLTLQCFIIIGGVTKFIPLTGITLPFISYGGSSLLTSMILVGIMEGVAIKRGEDDERVIKSIGGDVV